MRTQRNGTTQTEVLANRTALKREPHDRVT